MKPKEQEDKTYSNKKRKPKLKPVKPKKHRYQEEE